MAEPGAPAHRAGVVALLGPPNAGKSTLLNAVLGEKLAIVTARPQTTRSRILGVLTLEGAQIAFVDTPGRHAGTKPLNVALNEAVTGALEGCDVALLLMDLTRDWSEVHGELWETLRGRRTPVLVVGTKADLPGADRGPWPPPGTGDAAARLRLSARTGEGIPALLRALVGVLPESPALYPDDSLTDRPVRWLTGELVREAATEELAQELPYQVAVQVMSFEEGDPALVRIRARLLVARESQKRIVVGRGGEMVKRIGMRARRAIEELVGRQVYLELRVRVDPTWLKSPKRMRQLGYGNS